MAQKPYILLVDDNDDLADTLKLVLEMEGYRVQTAACGSAALRLINQELPCLIVADIVMPETSGYELFNQIKSNQAWAAVPFIFLSALTTAEEIDRGRRLGANAYLTKPFAIGDLLAIVHRYG